VCSADAPPSYAPPSTELEALERITGIVSDSMLSEFEEGAKPKAATVNSAFVLGICSSTYGNAELKNAINGAIAYDACKDLEGKARYDCQLERALVNIGSIMAKRVEGRVSTEIDPRLANDTEAIVAQAKNLQASFKEAKVPSDKVLYTIPSTWEGIQAAKQLESLGIQCHMVHCYSYVQAVAAAQAGASVIQINVGRIDDWYLKNPNFIRDPSGPRQDAGLVSDVDPGVKLMIKVYNYVKKFHPDVQLMASGVRSKTQALALAGLDYIVVSPQVIKALEAAPTLSGFNDGLHAGTDSADDIEVVLSPRNARSNDILKAQEVLQPEFVDELGYLGFDLLKTSLAGATSNAERCEPFFQSSAGGQE